MLHKVVMGVMSIMHKLIYCEFEQIIRDFYKPINKDDLSKTLLKAGLKESEYYCVELIDKHQLSKIRRLSGGIDVNKDIVEFYYDKDVDERTIRYFQSHILPNIGRSHYLDLIAQFNKLIQIDTFIDPKQASIYVRLAEIAEQAIVSTMNMNSNTIQERSTKASKESEAYRIVAEFLAKVFIYCIQQKRELKNMSLMPVHNLMSQNHKFTGRAELLQELSENFRNGSHIQVLSGMLGVGKTQVALEFAYKNMYKYSTIWWINAEDETTMLESCNAYLRCKDIPNLNHSAQSFCDFFNRYDDYWLLIYDNAELSSTKRKQVLDSYIPKNRKNGNVLITSRCKNDFYSIPPITVNAFTSYEAIGFVRNNLEKDQLKGDKYLAKRLGFLPLALSYAVAYIKQTPSCNCSGYLKKLSKTGVKLFEIGDDISLDYYKKTVRAAFMVSVEDVYEKSKNGDKFMSAVLEFIYATAYFPSNNIDLNLITSLCGNFSPVLDEILHDHSLFDKLVRILISRSLYYVVKNPVTEPHHEYNNQILGMHRLFQEILINELPPIFPEEWNKIYYPFPHKSQLKTEPLLPRTIMGEATDFTNEDILSILPLLYSKMQILQFTPGAMKNTIGIIVNIEKFLSDVEDYKKAVAFSHSLEQGYELADIGIPAIKELQNYSYRFLYFYVELLRVVIRSILLNDGHLVGLCHLDGYDEELATTIIDIYASLFFSLNLPRDATEQEFDENREDFRIYIQMAFARVGHSITTDLLDHMPDSMNINDILKNMKMEDDTE